MGGIEQYIASDQLPPILGGTFEGANAWENVMNASINATECMEAAADNDDDEEDVNDDDTQWMKEKTLAFEKGTQKNRMSKIMAIGKNKLSTAKTKIIESKDKIKQKRDERKIKKNAAATAKQEEEENEIPVESKKAAKILT